jgi:hypothetical protein
MNTVAKWIVAVVIMGANASAGAQVIYNVIYNVTDFQVGGGDYLTGNIVVTNAAVTAGGLLASGADFVGGEIRLYNTSNTLLGPMRINGCPSTSGCGLAVSGAFLTLASGDLSIVGAQAVCDIGITGSCATHNPFGVITSSVQYTGSQGMVFATARPTAAPEIDSGSAASGLALLVGGLVVLRGRRPQRPTA